MALENNRSESVDILNRKTGDLVTQYSGPGDRVVNITQSSVVRINASPESVNFYERQGDDLIVHMRDGSTVRYQNFFHLDADGLHSELIFEDQYGTHHAVFPFATEAGPAAAEAIVPVMADTSLGALIGGEGLSTAAILGGLAAVGGIAGVAIAASGGGGGGAAAVTIATAVTAVETVERAVKTAVLAMAVKTVALAAMMMAPSAVTTVVATLLRQAAKTLRHPR
ncbi:BapA prefix-like domain-containing protein [Atlantibacter sp.]|uniref:BapA prefix-like domain-containing protein n=1 Tax=Atlantibacter sp. TaxID=1903473 RepID=UPI0028B102BA|nr:BapA prefix-like domain-containing protein [Atlantibacter sp.]